MADTQGRGSSCRYVDPDSSAHHKLKVGLEFVSDYMGTSHEAAVVEAGYSRGFSCRCVEV
jgi:hypothetical protein